MKFQLVYILFQLVDALIYETEGIICYFLDAFQFHSPISLPMAQLYHSELNNAR